MGEPKNRREQEASEIQQKTLTSKGEATEKRPPQICGFCNEEAHSMAKCEEFTDRCLRYAHCGAKEHASHLCEKRDKSGNW